MLEVFTVSFFGHRYIDNYGRIESKLATLTRKLLSTGYFIEFLVGRDGDFDQIVSSTIRAAKRAADDNYSVLVWVMAYPKAEYANNAQSFEDYYDEIEVSDAASRSHFKAAILIRNREMIDRSDLVVCFVERKSGGAFAALQYAQKKKVINLAEDLVLYAE